MKRYARCAHPDHPVMHSAAPSAAASIVAAPGGAVATGDPAEVNIPHQEA